MRNQFAVIVVGVIVALLIYLGLLGQHLARQEQAEAARQEEKARQAALEQSRQAQRLRQLREQEGVGDPNGPEILQDALKHTPSIPNTVLTGLDLEDLKDPREDVQSQRLREEQAKLIDQLARDERNGFDAMKIKELSARHLRQSRWIIILPREDPETYRKNLIQLRAMLAISDGESFTTCMICEDLTKAPLTWKRVDQEGIKKYNCLWFQSQSATDCEYLAEILGLASPPRWSAVFIPNDLELLMADMEFTNRKLPAAELTLRKWISIFEIERRGKTWNVRVRYQGPRMN